MPRRTVPRPADLSDPDPQNPDHYSSSSDHSAQNLAKLRTNWKWAAFSQFFYTFSQLFNMEDVSLADIEDDLSRESNIFLPRVMARLLFVLSYDRKVSLDNWQSALRRQHKRRDPASNPIGPEPHTSSNEPRYRYESVSVDNATPSPDDAVNEDAAGTDADVPSSGKATPELASSSRVNAEEKASPSPDPTQQHDQEQEQEVPVQEQETKDWLDLPMLAKLDSMHLLAEWQFQNPTRLRTLMKTDDEDATWRIEPIGYDGKSNAYWLIGADRLWIQRPPAKPQRYTATTSSLKRKRPEALKSTAKPKRPAAKRARLATEGSAKLTITVPGGGRAAKTQAKLRLDAQAKELAELNRAARLQSTEKRGGRTMVPRPLGTRVSARLKGGDEDGEWQAVPEDWLADGGSSEKKTSVKQRAKTGLESDDDSVSELTELSEEPVDEAKDEEAAELSQASDNAGDTQPDDFVEWETICVTLFDWEHIAERFEKGTHYTEKALYKVLVKEIVPVITEELREIERKRRLEEAIVHRKRSSRIAQRETEKEEARMIARQKTEAAEKKSRAQRLEARLAKEEAERERREAAREQRRKDRETEEAQAAAGAEREREEIHVDVVGSDRSLTQPNQGVDPGTSRRNGVASTSTLTSGVRTPIGDDWVLSCEICHRFGLNVDDGMPMLCCGLCSQWQHIACHDQIDKRAGRPPRNWDQVEFVCRQCQARRVVSKNPRQYLQPTVSNSHVPQAAHITPSTSYSTYGHGPPSLTVRQQQDYPASYPVAVNGTTYTQPALNPSRQLPYPTPPSPLNFQQGQPAPAPTSRPSAGPSYNGLNTQQPYQNAYHRSTAQSQHTSSNLNGHRALAYQHPIANYEPSAGYNVPYASTNGTSRRTDGEHQYFDGAQRGTPAAAYRYQ
ncbi:hypothetical protein GGX14DRAFT_432652 [Mycena pura]|uniref:Zinc finger PHD-type domain-containing protein n=1 Tax=Mycena pura TaxID=153505 RepID=A0AAD6VQF1_9AGAR|nr:hypothetical protein GGX14DRAFT_432652 [Mycena pura]